jgi:hypothetical protein
MLVAIKINLQMKQAGQVHMNLDMALGYSTHQVMQLEVKMQSNLKNPVQRILCANLSILMEESSQ